MGVLKIAAAFLFFGGASVLAAQSPFPDSQDLLSWQSSDEPPLVFETYPSFSQIQLRKLCPQFSKLYPTHPQQDLKIYSQNLWASYSLEKLPATSRACLRQSLGNHPFCLRSDAAHDDILSDTFSDSCGNLYRAFHRVQYLGQDENMGTLSSPGRTTYPDPEAQFKGQYIVGGTFAVPATEFIKIGPLLSTDLEAIQSLKNRALEQGFKFNPQGLTYSAP